MHENAPFAINSHDVGSLSWNHGGGVRQCEVSRAALVRSDYADFVGRPSRTVPVLDDEVDSLALDDEVEPVPPDGDLSFDDIPVLIASGTRPVLFQEDVDLAPDENLDIHMGPVDHRVCLGPATPGYLPVRLIGDPDGPEALELVSAWFDAPPAWVVVGIGGVPLELAGSIGRNRGRDRTSVDSGVEVDVEALAANRFAVGLAQLGVDVEGLLEVEDLKGGSVRESVGDVVRPEGTDLGDRHARV